VAIVFLSAVAFFESATVVSDLLALLTGQTALPV